LLTSFLVKFGQHIQAMTTSLLGTWCLEFGAWDLGLGAWNLVLGIWCLGLGIWDLGFGIYPIYPLCSALKTH
jgi:hypothetical protein